MKSAFLLIFILLAWGIPFELCAGAEDEDLSSKTATIHGRILKWNWTGRGPDLPQPWLPVYLFTMEQSRILQALQKESRAWGEQAMKIKQAGGTGYVEVAEKVGNYLEALELLIPATRASATTKTDSAGFYRFENVVPGKMYQIWGYGEPEDGEHFLFVGVTPKLEPGIEIRFDLRDKVDWNEQYVKEDNSSPCECQDE